jgi:hypothetical protein
MHQLRRSMEQQLRTTGMPATDEARDSISTDRIDSHERTGPRHNSQGSKLRLFAHLRFEFNQRARVDRVAYPVPDAVCDPDWRPI